VYRIQINLPHHPNNSFSLLLFLVEDSLVKYQNNIKSVQVDQVGLLIGLVNDIKNSGSCAFLKSTWEETYEILCIDARDGLNTLGSMSFVSCFILFSRGLKCFFC
jgi:hypothetical protein